MMVSTIVSVVREADIKLVLTKVSRLDQDREMMVMKEERAEAR